MRNLHRYIKEIPREMGKLQLLAEIFLSVGGCTS
jgi:hypothetical protein